MQKRQQSTETMFCSKRPNKCGHFTRIPYLMFVCCSEFRQSTRAIEQKHNTKKCDIPSGILFYFVVRNLGRVLDPRPPSNQHGIVLEFQCEISSDTFDAASNVVALISHLNSNPRPCWLIGCGLLLG